MSMKVDAPLKVLAEGIELGTGNGVEPDEEGVADDQLRLIFTCCHPARSPDARVALTLREVCGLTTEEIAHAFLTATPTVAQRIVRAKSKTRDARIPYRVPSRADLCHGLPRCRDATAVGRVLSHQRPGSERGNPGGRQHGAGPGGLHRGAAHPRAGPAIGCKRKCSHGKCNHNLKGTNMRFMMLIKANKDSEAGVLPSRELVAAMGEFNEEMVHAGVLLAGEGLHPSSKGARVHFSGGKRTVTDGPFAKTKELIAGFWLIDVDSKEEAIDWARRVPDPMGEGEEAEIEIRQVFDESDFPPDILPPEQAAREQELRRRLEGRLS